MKIRELMAYLATCQPEADVYMIFEWPEPVVSAEQGVYLPAIEPGLPTFEPHWISAKESADFAIGRDTDMTQAEAEANGEWPSVLLRRVEE